MLKNLLLFCVLGIAAAIGASAATTGPTASVSWTAPTLNTDGSTITGAITYNLYQGLTGAITTAVQKGMTATVTQILQGLTPGTTQCFAVTAVVGGLESAQSAPACAAIPLPSPDSPTQITVVIH